MQIDPGFKPLLREGHRDLAVRAAQNAVRRGLAAHGLAATNLANGGYGSKTKDDIARFERAVGMSTAQGANIGPETWRHLTPYLSKTDKQYLSKRRRQVIGIRTKFRAQQLARIARERDPQRRIEVAAEQMWNARGHLRYSWLRPFLYKISAARTYDCSGTVSVIYENAGLEDPNGLDHNGYGFTGTLWPNGHAVSSGAERVGDLAFYGYDQRGPYPSHVAIVVSEAFARRMLGSREVPAGSGLHVLTFGHDPMKIERLRYRDDYRGCRRYF